jgi:pyridoxine 5-phosphate synthase
MKILNVNIDHIATIRQARLGKEPDPVLAAQIAVLAGADGIVAHLREDRRHINDRDVYLIKEMVDTRFDLEMAANEEIVKIALDIKPQLVTIVPEKREELTTEGGLNLLNNIDFYRKLAYRMSEQNIKVSFFIEPDKKQIDAAVKCNADIVEIHTGTYANKFQSNDYESELERIVDACEYAFGCGLTVAAGHGLNYSNVKILNKFCDINEFSIGHSIISRAAFVGLDRAVRDMVTILNEENW